MTGAGRRASSGPQACFVCEGSGRRRMSVLRKAAKPAAWLLVAAIALVTLGPIEIRPTSGLPVSLERLVAFGCTGAAFALAYPQRRTSVLAGLVALAGVLEFLQLLVPTRHGQLFDFGVKAAGSLGGVTVTTLAEKLWPTRLRQGT